MKIKIIANIAINKIQKIIDHSSFGSAPFSAKEINADILAQLIDLASIISHIFRSVPSDIVSRVIQKIEVFVGIGEVVKTGQGISNHSYGLFV